MSSQVKPCWLSDIWTCGAVSSSSESGDGTLGRLLQDTSTAVELESTLAELSELIEDIRENPNRYVRLSIF